MRIAIRRIGNSKGMIIPTALLKQVGLDGEAEVCVENGALVVRAPVQLVRNGWGAASQAVAAAGDDELSIPPFQNHEDASLVW